ncbi:hypothetical protein ACD591_14205 [Rufibacter glacialis]|uniref:Uncharacterized protein n=1 Tax=Rufibacter glacialis TaxID=1259555 RepID=A0A5M8Q6Y3_9BACT|nr:hypothetical protein [Rufibacter glacialis]KAA6431003.1 hypothetical protein FOE74_18020 [Rufibacter glacialis]
MEPLTHPSPASAARQKKSFFSVGFALLLLALLGGAMFLFKTTSPQPATLDSTTSVAPATAGPEITAPRATDLPNTAPSGQVMGTTADLASHPMFAPLQQQLPDSMPLIFRPEKWEGKLK